EAPFVLVVGDRVLRGRIDAVYRRDGHLELVDFKTGSEPAEGDRGAGVQLDLYALAAVDAWGEPVDGLRTTYCYLRATEPARLVSTDWDEARLAAVRATLADQLAAIAGDRFPATPGSWCTRCEFLPFCGPGQRSTG